MRLKRENFSVFKENFVPEYFWLEIEKNIAIFKISTLKFFGMQSPMQKQKLLTFTRKSVLFGYSWDRIVESHCHT